MTSAFQASVLIGLLLAVAAGVGLFVPGSYEADTAFAAAAFRGTDLVSLVVAMLALAGSLFLARRGSRRALLVWLGTLAYITYTYLYSFAIVWNRLFLVYVALLSLSGFTLVRALTALDANQLADQFTDHTPVRTGARSCGSSGPCLADGAGPGGADPPGRRGSRRRGQTGHPTGVIYILDLRLVVPLLVLAGRWLRARRPWGYVAAGILLVKGITVGLGLLASNLFGYLDNGHTDGALLGLWALIATASLLMPLRYLRAVDDQPIGPLANSAAEHDHERN